MMDGPMTMGWFWVWPVLVLAGVLLLGYVGYQLARGGTAADGPRSARQIVDERYARGEIGDEEYRRRRDELR